MGTLKKAAAVLSALAMLLAGSAAVLPANETAYIASAASAEEYTESTYESLTYQNYGDHIVITDCDTTVTSVIIPSEIDDLPVTEIGDYAFRNCDALTYVNIADTVTSIGTCAFYSCGALPSVTIPDSVTHLGSLAFYLCESLKSAILSDNLTTISESTFAYCPLTSIVIPDSVTEIEPNAFDSTELTSVTLPANIAKIGINAFRTNTLTEFELAEDNAYFTVKDGILYNKELTEVIKCPSALAASTIILPDSVTKIHNYAFYNCDNLTSVLLSNNLQTIGDAGFFGSELTSVSLPDSVTYIGESAFSNCYSLKSVILSDQLTEIPYQAFRFCESLTSVVIPESVSIIGEDAFSLCALTSITIPDGVTQIHKNAFDINSITSVTIPDSVTYLETPAFDSHVTFEVSENNPNYCSENGVLFSKDKTALLAYPWVLEAESYTIPDGVTTIGENAFYNCDDLTSITIPDSVTHIMTYAFVSCEGLASITIPDSVTYLGDHAFSGCSNLADVSGGKKLTSIGDNAFYDTSWLNNYAEGMIYMGKVLLKCNETLPENCDVVLAPGTVAIAGGAFENCLNMISITIPETVTSIGPYAFYNTGLKEIVIPEGVTRIENNTFESSTSLTKVTLPESITSIGDEAFHRCTNLTDINFPESITFVGDYAFSSTAMISPLTQSPQNPPVYMGKALYAGYHIESPDLVVADGTTCITGHCFWSCFQAASVVIPETVTYIGPNAFANCSYLTDVYFKGTEEEWEAMEIKNGNTYLKNAVIHFNYTEPVTEASLYGDANEDGDVTVADVIAVNKYYMKTGDLSEQGFVNADVDTDSDADLSDSLNILKSLIDLIDLPIVS